MSQRELDADRTVRAGAGEILEGEIRGNDPGIGESNSILAYGPARYIKGGGKIDIRRVAASLSNTLHDLDPLLFHL